MSFLKRPDRSTASVCDVCGAHHPHLINWNDYVWMYWYHKHDNNFHLCKDCIQAFPKVSAEFSAWEANTLSIMHYQLGTEIKS